MNISQTTLRIGAVLGTIGAIVVLAASAQAATPKPAEMSQPEYRALMIRSEALNEKYHLGIWANKPASVSARDRALILRSEALNRKYGLGGSTAKTASVAPAIVAGSGFAWADFGIGAATILGVVLVGIGVFFGSRHGRGSLRAHRSS